MINHGFDILADSDIRKRAAYGKGDDVQQPVFLQKQNTDMSGMRSIEFAQVDFLTALVRFSPILIGYIAYKNQL